MDYEHIFPLLTNQEFAVLYWKCQGLTHEDIGLKFNYSAAWIQEHSSKAHKKLGITGHPSQRDKILQEKVCPALFEWVKQNPERIKALPPPIEQVQQSVVGFTSEKSASTPSSNKTVEPPPITIKNPKALPGPSVHWFVRLLRYAIFALVGLLLVSTVGFFAFQYGRSFSPVPNGGVLASPTMPVESATLSLLSSPTIEMTATFEPTQTETPSPVPPTATNTEVPPTPTSFVPPADGILFQDNFDNGASDLWRPDSGSGTWRVVNGRYTFNSEDRFNWYYNFVGDSSWGNYVVELDYSLEPDSYANLAILIRSGITKRFAMAFMIGGYDVYWSAWDGEWNGLVGASGDWSDTGHVKIEVQGNTYTGQVTGYNSIVVTDSQTTHGAIGIGVHCRGYDSCPRIDNVKVTYLP